jgi:hypothetical protein
VTVEVAGGLLGDSAVFSDCGAYRYALWRRWGQGSAAMFVGLNPSTADETQDDPTVRRCIRFARDWGHDALVMTNLFAWRSTDPLGLRAPHDPVGPENDRHLFELARGAGVVIAAWGVHGTLAGRAERVVESGILGPYYVLGLTKDGHPRHPLYMPARCVPLDPISLAAA